MATLKTISLLNDKSYSPLESALSYAYLSTYDLQELIEILQEYQPIIWLVRIKLEITYL